MQAPAFGVVRDIARDKYGIWNADDFQDGMLFLFRGFRSAGNLQYTARQELRQQGNAVFR
jgi:hypothetical protein